MTCISAASAEEKCKLLTTATRNEIVRDLVTQMYAHTSKPDRPFCTVVAKSLVKKYPFMKDAGRNVSGYVSKPGMLLCQFSGHWRLNSGRSWSLRQPALRSITV